MFEDEIITFCSRLPKVSCKKMKRTNCWRLFYKPGHRYAHSWDIWNHVKFMYETMNKKPLSVNDVKLRVFENYIEVF
jgi:hypothetical protein